MMSQAEVESYRRDGYVVSAQFRSTHDQVAALREELDEALAAVVTGSGSVQ